MRHSLTFLLAAELLLFGAISAFMAGRRSASHGHDALSPSGRNGNTADMIPTRSSRRPR